MTSWNWSNGTPADTTARARRCREEEDGDATCAHAAQLIARLSVPADHPRLVHIDLPDTVTVPPPLAARLGRLFRTVRRRNTALGVSAVSAKAIVDLSGSGSLLSTVSKAPARWPAQSTSPAR